MTKSTPKPIGRDAKKAWHRMKIIEATVDIVAHYGIAGTTISRVVELAGVSRGLVNVHFKSKDKLLSETARYMSDCYRQSRKQVIESAMNCPVKQIETLIHSDFCRTTLNERSVGFWMAIRSHFRYLPEYIPLADTTRDPEFRQELLEPIQKINKEGNYNIETSVIVDGLIALLGGLWMDFYMYPEKFDRLKAISTSLFYLSAFFPQHFDKPTLSSG